MEPPGASRRSAAAALDRYIPTYDARERFQVRVRAPAPLVYDTAVRFDIQSVPLVQGIFRLREWLLQSRPSGAPPFAGGFLAGARQIGWGILEERQGERCVAGAFCQPWLADVGFTPLAADTFAAFAAPDQVKIAWTLETVVLDEGHSILASETRAVATTEEARRRFRHYWRWARFGIHAIRWLLLPAIRRQAEARFA